MPVLMGLADQASFSQDYKCSTLHQQEYGVRHDAELNAIAQCLRLCKTGVVLDILVKGLRYFRGRQLLII
jgi:hypothetical protein